jgi:hypothetical protein
MAKRSKKRPIQGSQKKNAARKARAETLAARLDVHGSPSDQAWGTSPGALGVVKAASEEARHVTCSECGYSSGRHSRFCIHYAK